MDEINVNIPNSPSSVAKVNQKAIHEFVRVGSHSPSVQEQEQAEKVTDKEISQAMERGNKILRSNHTDLHIQFHDDTKRKIVQIKNQLSGETIREFPSKEFVRWEAEFTKLLGLLMDKKI